VRSEYVLVVLFMPFLYVYIPTATMSSVLRLP